MYLMARPKTGITFWDRVNSHIFMAASGCHEFTGHRDECGYGRIYKDGRLIRIHRAQWEERFGPIPEGKQVLHKCDNPPCINIDHLFLGDHNINMADKRAKGRCAQLKGSKNGASKLTEQQVSVIKLRLRNGDSPISISKDYGVSDTNIRLIKKGLKWRHVA